jgi:hypothetical protein
MSEMNSSKILFEINNYKIYNNNIELLLKNI